MKLTKAFEQGVCIMSLLSTQKRDVPLSTQVINERLLGSQTYIQKIIRKLVVAGLVNSVSGNNGGFVLAKEPSKINLLEIVEALEGEIDTYPNSGLFAGVFKNMKKAKKGDLIIHRAIRLADKAWMETLKNKTVQDLLDETFSEK